MGGNYPVRLQSMTNTKTLHTNATVEQAIRIFNEGADLVRITAQNIKEAENLKKIKAELKKKGYDFPIIADIHYNPQAAEISAKIVEKIRINPGNYVDKKSIRKINYSAKAYQKEIDKIREKITPLIKICKEYNTAIRIGSNHGSLSDRILSRYGDTPLGMAESAMEFLRICHDLDFHNIVVSMKASSARVMIQATRLLVKKMMEEGMNYPLHLGVTEAGEGDDGRIKSAVGIGTLLADGIGDTIRVSLTEAPEKEIPVAKIIADYFSPRKERTTETLFTQTAFNPFEYKKRETIAVRNIGGNHVPVVIADFGKSKEISFSKIDSDYFFTGNRKLNFKKYPNINFIVSSKTWKNNFEIGYVFPLFSKTEYIKSENKSAKINFIQAGCNDLDHEFCEVLKKDKTAVLFLTENNFQKLRAGFIKLVKQKCKTPVIICKLYLENSLEQIQIKSACDFGPLLVDGFGDGILLGNQGQLNVNKLSSISYGILQATGTRITKTEYISCPTCGRTQYDIEKVLASIKRKTSHLKGLKIAVMGCMVNGPGEMADADYGYVGAGPGRVNLYHRGACIKKNILSSDAINELISLIKENRDWIDK